MNTQTPSLPLAAASARPVRRHPLPLALLLASTASGLLAQTPTPAISVAHETPNSYECDVYRWYDSAGNRRSAALSRNNAADPGGSHGGVLYQYQFTPAGTTTPRTVTGTGSHSLNGFGYIVNHHSGSAYVSRDTTGTYRTAFAGRHHAIHEYQLTYDINGTDVTATIQWYFATGQDHPIYAITFDTSAAGPSGLDTDADSRAPYGDMQFGGDGSNPQVSGIGWGDKYKFVTTSAPLTPQSAWDYSQPNTVPYTLMWINSPDAEMGAVQTQTWLQHNTGGSWFTSNWGRTSANRDYGDGSSFAGWSGDWMMPVNWQWPYQLNQYEMMDDTSPTTSKRCAWGLMYGAVGKPSYSGYGYENTYSGHPYQSYSLATVIGRHSTADVSAQVARTERVLAATLAANTGSLVSSGPGGVGRTDSVAYAKPGYNAIYGAYELTAASGSFSASLSSAAAIKNPTFLIHGMGGIPAQISLDGTALFADQGYYASYDAANQTVWLTVAADWTGSHTIASGAGVPPNVTVSVAPTTATLGRSMSTTFVATVDFAANTSVTWSVVEPGGGTVTTGGTYTAPTTLGTYHVRATSVQDPTRSAEAAVTVVAPSVAITPSSLSIAPSGSTSFTATVTNAATTTVVWSVIEAGGGTVSSSGVYTAPAATGTYHVRATSTADPAQFASATITVADLAPTYTYVYQSGLQGGWTNASWGATVNYSASTLGHAGTAAIEVTAPGSWQGFSVADVANWQNTTYYYLSEVDTVEFDIYPHSDSVDFASMVFDLDDGDDNTAVDTPKLVDLIPGWAGMTDAQRYDHWHHVVVDLDSLNAESDRFFRLTFFKYSASGSPHFRLADIRLGSVLDITPPTVTVGDTLVSYDQLLLPFTTDESAVYRVEYGYGDYSLTLTGPADGWATNHNPVLTGLTRGATVTYRIVATDHAGNAGFATGSAVITDPPPPTEPTVTISVDPTNTHTISPWIYGMNFYQSSDTVARNLTLNRAGGNRWTAYNWENNASNAGNDWYFHNDAHLGGGTVPGEAIRARIAEDRIRGSASLITVQMQGHVAADKNGDNVIEAVPDYATRMATRFKQVVAKKSTVSAAPFTTAPDTTDANVFIDEMVWALDALVPGDIYTDPLNPTMLLLDNEPELWASTHEEIQNSPETAADYIAKTITLTKAIKDVAPAVKIFGPVHYGFNGITNFQGDTGSGFNANYWFTDKYLAEMKAASDADGRRLVDVYNFHWYSEVYVGGTRIVNLTSDTLSEAQIQAIVQSPRSLWDPTYREASWVANWFNGPIQLLPRLKAKIAANWPGTGLAITEWHNGGGNHIAGAIAVADNLGIFGQQDLFESSMWPNGDASDHSFDFAGFKMYRDFDGALSTFGDICLPTVSDHTDLVSAYVSSDSAVPGRHVIVAINRSNAPQAVNFTGLGLAGTARMYRLTNASTTPVYIGSPTVDLATWITPLPAYSITTIEIIAGGPVHNYAAWRAANFSGADLADDAVSGPLADPDGAGVGNLVRYACNLAARGPVEAPTTQGVATTGSDTFLTLSFTRRASADDLIYTVETSDDLATWTTLESFQPGAPAAVTAQDSVALGTAGVTRRFLRLRIDLTQ